MIESEEMWAEEEQDDNDDDELDDDIDDVGNNEHNQDEEDTEAASVGGPGEDADRDGDGGGGSRGGSRGGGGGSGGGYGYDSDDEEWATLYGRGGGRGILNPLPDQRPPPPMATREASHADGLAGGVDDGGDSGGSRRTRPDGTLADSVAAEEAVAGATAASLRTLQEKKGWWGGSAWGGLDIQDRGTGNGDIDGDVGSSKDADTDTDGDLSTVERTSAYIVLCRRGGSLEIFACEGRGTEATTRAVFRTSAAALAPPTLWNELLSPRMTSANNSTAAARTATGNNPSSNGLHGDAVEGDGVMALSAGGGGGLSPMDQESDEDEADGERVGGEGLSVATGVVVASGRRAAGGGGGSSVPSANAAELDGQDKGKGKDGDRASNSSSPDPMVVDGSTRAEDTTGAGGTATVGNVNGNGISPANAEGATGAAANGSSPLTAAASSTNGSITSNGVMEARHKAGPGGTGTGVGEEDDGVSRPVVMDVIVHPVGSVEGPAALRCLVLAMHLDNGDLLVYQARMSTPALREGAGREGRLAGLDGREQVSIECAYVSLP